MKSLAKIKILPVILMILALAGITYIAFINRTNDDSNFDTSSLVDELTPVINTLEIADGKKETIQGIEVVLPEGYSYVTIVNQQEYRTHKCKDEGCLIYIIQGNDREFVISTSEISNMNITNSLQEHTISLRGEDHKFNASLYPVTNEEGETISEDLRVEFVTGCISNLCYASDQMNILDKDANNSQLEQFRQFINDLTLN